MPSTILLYTADKETQSSHIHELQGSSQRGGEIDATMHCRPPQSSKLKACRRRHLLVSPQHAEARREPRLVPPVEVHCPHPLLALCAALLGGDPLHLEWRLSRVLGTNPCPQFYEPFLLCVHIPHELNQPQRPSRPLVPPARHVQPHGRAVGEDTEVRVTRSGRRGDTRKETCAIGIARNRVSAAHRTPSPFQNLDAL